MSEEHEIIYELEVDNSKARASLRQVETLAYRVIGLFRRIGLPENIDAAIQKIQRAIATIRLLHSSLVALEAASGPIGWALAITGIISAAWSTYDYAMDLRGV